MEINTLIKKSSVASLFILGVLSPTLGDTVSAETTRDYETMSGNPYYTWQATSKKYVSTTYGSFKVCGSGKTPATMSCSGKSSVSTTYSGELEIPVRTLGAYIGATINKATEKEHSYSKDFKDKGHHELLVRTAYKNYNVVQTRYMHLDGQKYKTSTTKTVKVKKYSHLDYSWR